MTWLLHLVLSSPLASPEPSAVELQQLEAGRVVVRSDTARGGSTGLSMRLVEATAEQIWAVVLDFDGYVDFLPYVTASWTESGPAELGPGRYRWGMELTTRGVTTRYRVDCRGAEGELDWTMRPVGASPMRSSTGSWRVLPWDAHRVLLVYVASVDTAWWVPPSLHRQAADRGLSGIVELVAQQAEDR